MLKHEGHHHHYYKAQSSGLAVKRTMNTHWHQPDMRHRGNDRYGGPCICTHDVWQDAKDAQWGLVDAWDNLKKEGSGLWTSMLRALFTLPREPKE